MTTHDGDGFGGWVGADNLGQESRGSEDVQGGDTEQLLWVVDALLLQNFGDNRDGGVDWVGDDQQGGVRCAGGSGLGQVSDDGGVGVEQVVSGHTWLSWDTGWDQDHVGVLQGLGQTVVFRTKALDGGVGWDVRQVRGDTLAQSQVVQGQVADLVVQLHQEGQWLSNSTGRTQNGHLVGGGGGGGELSDGGSGKHAGWGGTRLDGV